MSDFEDQWAAATKLAEQYEQTGEFPASNETETEAEEPAISAPAEPTKTAEKPAKPAPAKPAKDPAKPDQQNEEDRNEGVISVAERAKWRAEKRAWREQKAAEQAAIEKAKQEAEQSTKKWRDAEEIWKRGDPEGAIQTAFGKPFAEFAKDVMAKAQGKDPRLVRELEELKAKQAEREAREAEAQKRAQLAAAQVQQERAAAAYVQNQVIPEMKQLEGAEHLAEVPVFVQAVVQEQRAAYDPDTKETITIAEAVEAAKAKFLPVYQTLQRVFGDQPASAAEGAKAPANRPGVAVAGKNGAKKRVAHISNTRATSASRDAEPPDSLKDPAGWSKWATQQLEAAKD